MLNNDKLTLNDVMTLLVDTVFFFLLLIIQGKKKKKKSKESHDVLVWC